MRGLMRLKQPENLYATERARFLRLSALQTTHWIVDNLDTDCKYLTT